MTASASASETSRRAAPSTRSGVLTRALTRRGKDGFSGTLHVGGEHASRVTLVEGRVVEAATPFAPGIESLLLRSGRVTEAQWSETFEAAAPYGRLGAELVERGLLGSAAVEVLTQTAVLDAIFAMAFCGVSSCTAEPADPADLMFLLPANPGLDAERVVRETVRRLAATAEWEDLGLRLRSRPSQVGAEAGPAIPRGRSDILAAVNGRRTPRDIAFSVGRGLFSVMTDLAFLLKDGLITVVESAESAEPAAPQSPDEAPAPLPRRRRTVRAKKPPAK